MIAPSALADDRPKAPILYSLKIGRPIALFTLVLAVLISAQFHTFIVAGFWIFHHRHLRQRCPRWRRSVPLVTLHPTSSTHIRNTSNIRNRISHTRHGAWRAWHRHSRHWRPWRPRRPIIRIRESPVKTNLPASASPSASTSAPAPAKATGRWAIIITKWDALFHVLSGA